MQANGWTHKLGDEDGACSGLSVRKRKDAQAGDENGVSGFNCEKRDGRTSWETKME